MFTTPIPWLVLVLSVGIPIIFIVGVRYIVAHTGGRSSMSPIAGAGQDAFPLHISIPRSQVKKLLLAAIFGLGALVILMRFIFGIGAVSHMSDSFPWGIWIGIDVMGGVALAAGAFVIAGAAHIFGVHRLEPLVRPAILTGFLGYLLVVCGLVVDLGRPYNIWRPLVHWQHHSVMWEVGMCVFTYTIVLFIEFLPVILERINRFEAIATRLPTIPLYQFLRKISIIFVILGVILSTLHQSSLGSLWVLVPTKLNPLWYSIYLPVFFWISAIAIGLTMTIVESTLSSRAFNHGLETDLLADLAKWAVVVLGIYLVAKFADLIARDAWPLLFEPTVQAAAFWLEIGLGVIIPMILFSRRTWRENPRILFTGAALAVVGFALNRLNIPTVGMWQWSGVRYFPSWMEAAVTLSLITLGVMAFALAAKYLPVFPEEHHIDS